MGERLTYHEELHLRRLALCPRDDYDTVSERTLVGMGYATRVGLELVITEAGRAVLRKESQ